MRKRKLTVRNARKVFGAVLAADPAIRDHVIAAFNAALDELRDMDAFGTEGQCDPRGDQRE